MIHAPAYAAGLQEVLRRPPPEQVQNQAWAGIKKINISPFTFML